MVALEFWICWNEPTSVGGLWFGEVVAEVGNIFRNAFQPRMTRYSSVITIVFLCNWWLRWMVEGWRCFKDVVMARLIYGDLGFEKLEEDWDTLFTRTLKSSDFWVNAYAILNTSDFGLLTVPRASDIIIPCVGYAATPNISAVKKWSNRRPAGTLTVRQCWT